MTSFGCLSIRICIVLCLASLSSAIIFEEFNKPHVWITISSLANKNHNDPHKGLLFRQVELNWINAPQNDKNSYIGLYLDSEPDGDFLPVSVHRLNGQKSGHIITDYYLPQIDFYNDTNDISSFKTTEPDQYNSNIEISNSKYLAQNITRSNTNNNNNNDNNDKQEQVRLDDECIGYCIAMHSEKKILAQNCLKTNPNWMSESYSHLSLRSIPWIMLPGTHNSATYPRHLDKSALQMINKYQLNQDENIFNQLIYGIRHLDLRVGYHKVKHRQERFWIYHDVFRTDVSLNEVFVQVRKFLELTSHEVIIMDFHRFTVGFQHENQSIQRDRHTKLISMLLSELGQYLVPAYLIQNVQINEFVSMGKRLIIGYANREILNGTMSNEENHDFNQYLGAPVRHLWPNKDTLEGLGRYMNETTCRKYFGDLRSLMAELTPTVFGVISDKYDGIRKLAQLVNRPVTDWIRDRWLHCVNIVATDFFLGNDLIQLSIESNRLRSLKERLDSNCNGGNDSNSNSKCNHNIKCKSFRQIEHLLDKSRIPLQFIYHDPRIEFNDQSGDRSKKRNTDNELKLHTSSDGKEIHVRLLAKGLNMQSSNRDKKDSFVDNFSEGFSDFFSSIKRMLRL